MARTHRSGTAAAPVIDIEVSGHGSIFLVTPKTDAAHDWLRGNVSSEAQRFARALAVEHRYIGDIVEGMIDAGLEVQAVVAIKAGTHTPRVVAPTYTHYLPGTEDDDDD